LCLLWKVCLFCEYLSEPLDVDPDISGVVVAERIYVFLGAMGAAVVVVVVVEFTDGFRDQREE
jgi:hypothetical protein